MEAEMKQLELDIEMIEKNDEIYVAEDFQKIKIMYLFKIVVLKCCNFRSKRIKPPVNSNYQTNQCGFGLFRTKEKTHTIPLGRSLQSRWPGVETVMLDLSSTTRSMKQFCQTKNFRLIRIIKPGTVSKLGMKFESKTKTCSYLTFWGD